MAQVEWRLIDDSFVQFLFGNAGTFDNQIATAVASIAIHHYFVGFVLVKRLAIRQA